MAGKKKFAWGTLLIWVLILGAAVGGGWMWYAQRQKAAAPKYELATITEGDVRSRVTATGNVQAVTQITVGSQVSGLVQNLYVDFNQKVRKGQALAQLDPSTFRAQVEQQTASVNNALASLNNQRANVGNQAANVRSAEAGVISAQAKVAAARGQLANANAAIVQARASLRKGQFDQALAVRNQKRQKELRDRDLVAAVDFDTARTTAMTSSASVDVLQSQIVAAQAGYQSAEANLQSAQAEVEAARMRVDAAREQLGSAQAAAQGAAAQVSQQQANLRQAQVNLNYTTIRSPIDGIVLNRKVTVGASVAAQFQAPDLFTMAENLNQIQVETNVDEADVGQIKPGAAATFTVDAYPDQRFHGKVSEVRQAPVTVQNVVTYVVIIKAKNEGEKLKPGMTATVNIDVDEREDVLLVPNSALRFKPPASADGEGGERRRGRRTPAPGETPGARSGGREGGRRKRKSTVYTLVNGKLVEHRIVGGVTDGVNTEIKEGDLKEDDQVVIGSDSSDSTTAGSSGGRGSGGGGRRGGGGPRMF